ncbi:MAG: ParB N-terminal domain-containing protein [Gemmatimonadetes bacterium]|uniref:ParB N-terminal domain-containing protein n=1 Tax=Candidatus Kutchimonas denitrificans TaxID=3056748 RepID=A0AAE4ZA75_9BACT|nr:ParB N-terminal domain-containing protein [Gemmatimonadota bacterium]NIR75898.1 ParB N-terminal domain-containing protein [Candidatus Kutchimonas denitrificans]NIS02059.1 ParB N-terminal domain-containing protein [Gemmatimonadota bacterium]NIT67865.1 ParB N-terminal domain-containing protein [Gemmatimonadota bacterium]NIU53844.1 ParB N-terminal domain-containing protein [Gemmatimonadota bacterium]
MARSSDEKRNKGGRKKKKEAPPKSRGLTAGRLASASPPKYVEALLESIEDDGGVVLGVYKDPLGGNWQALAGLPIDRVEPTPFQRDLSEAHTKKLADAIDKLDRFLDPVIAVRTDEGVYWTPNGYHRLEAVKRLGGRSIVALVVPEHEVAYRILVLNTEKAHNLRERALEVSRLAEGLATIDDRPEREFATEFEEPSLITLGFCYGERGRFAGGAYHNVIKRVDKFLGAKLSNALEKRRGRAEELLELDQEVSARVKELKEIGFESPYLKAYVVARINPLRYKRKVALTYDETMEKMLGSARRFDAKKVKADQVAGASGPSDE